MTDKDEQEKSKSKARELFTQVAQEQRPPATKRVVPKKKRTRADREARYQKYGKPAPYRLQLETIAAIDQAAKKHRVRKSRLVEVLLRQALFLLATDRIALPKADEELEGFYPLELPDLPSQYTPD
jgi:hypothetical protein